MIYVQPLKVVEIKVSVSDNEINILFYGGRVLSLNQVMAYLQKPTFF